MLYVKPNTWAKEPEEADVRRLEVAVYNLFVGYKSTVNVAYGSNKDELYQKIDLPEMIEKAARHMQEMERELDSDF